MMQSALPALGLLLLMVLAAFALQRWKGRLPGLGHAGGPALRVMRSVALGPQQRIVTVQVGEGAGAQCLVLGVAPGSVSTLHSLPLPPEAQPGAAAGPARPARFPGAASAAFPAGSFAARLAQLKNANHPGSHAHH